MFYGRQMKFFFKKKKENSCYLFFLSLFSSLSPIPHSSFAKYSLCILRLLERLTDANNSIVMHTYMDL